jgi:beta-galactosidase
VNGRSLGIKKRNSQDFPAAGLRWAVQFKEANQIRAVGRKDGTEVVDEITQGYQTQKWDKPAKFVLEQIKNDGDKVTVMAHAIDAKGVGCLDSRIVVRFGMAGDGRLIDNLGTSTGSRVVELYNGQALISAQFSGNAVISVSSKGLPTAFLELGTKL